MSIFRQILIISILVFIGAAGYFTWDKFGSSNSVAEKSKRRNDVVSVEVAQVEIRNLDFTVEAVGSTRARRAVDITPLASGRVIEITFKPGNNVKKNDILVRLDDEIQRADLKEAEAKLEEARSAMVRTTSLKRNSAVAAASVESQATAVATAEADLERAIRRLQDRTVRAPFSGIVGFSHIELGSRIKEGDIITTLDDLSTVEVEFSVPEVLFGRVHINQPVTATTTAFQQTKFSGTITSIDSRINPIARSVNTRAEIRNPDRLLPAGMFMHVSVALDPRQALTIPESAIQVQASESFVYVLKSSDQHNSVSKRKVNIGQRDFGFVEIVSGLEAGEEVVIYGVQRLREGVKVKRVEKGDGRKNKDRETPGSPNKNSTS